MVRELGVWLGCGLIYITWSDKLESLKELKKKDFSDQSKKALFSHRLLHPRVGPPAFLACNVEKAWCGLACEAIQESFSVLSNSFSNRLEQSLRATLQTSVMIQYLIGTVMQTCWNNRQNYI